MILHRLDRCPSTNDEAKALARRGAAETTVVVAMEQTAGRGTQGRSWFSGRGLGLYATVILRPPLPDIEKLPLAAGLAAQDAVKSVAGIQPGLREPNDILWGERKLGGILCESGFSAGQLTFAVVGVGLNVNHAEEDFPEEIRTASASLRMAAGRRFDPEDFLAPLVEALEQHLLDLRSGRGAEITAAFRRRIGDSAAEPS